MATEDQTQPLPAATGMGTCPNCRAPMSADQRYCLNCGARRGAPRVAPAAPGEIVEVAPAPVRPADVSPLAAVIGIALLGGMLLIGVLIGRSGSDDNRAPAPIVQVDPGQTTTPGTTTPATPPDAIGAVATDWPTDAQGFTIQLSLVPKDGATQETVDAAKEAATASGAEAVGVLDSDLYPSLTPGSYVIYSGIYTERQPAVTALGKLGDAFPDATVIAVEPGDKGAASGGVPEDVGGAEPEAVPEAPADTGEPPVVPPEDEGAAN